MVPSIARPRLRTIHATLAVSASAIALLSAQASAQASLDPAIEQRSSPSPKTQAGGIPRATDIIASRTEASDANAAARASGQDAAAQADTASDAEIIVTGIRASLANAQTIKRDADTVVDAITSEDIGALPDRSVTEALQRVPGVSITRFAGANDPDHFSVEGSGVVIRGLNYVRSEFNGRDTFSANGGRSLNFQDVSPELLGSVEVFKNMTADQIEGGVSGTVNLNTRKPFDSRDTVVYLSADMNYGDFAKRGSPAISALASTNIETGIGRFGVLVSGSYSQLFSRADGVQITNYQARFNGSRDINGDGKPETDTLAGLPAGKVVFAPIGAGTRIQDFNRERVGAAAALQFESLDKSLLATVQFIRSDARQTWGEHTFETSPDGADRATFPFPGTSYTFDDDGLFQTGRISIDRGYVPAGGQQRGMLTQLSNRGNVTRAVTNDFGGNVKWQATDKLSFNFDGQYVSSTSKQTDFVVFGSTFSDVQLDLTGDFPKVDFLAPNGAASTPFFANPANSYVRAAMDHFEDSDGHEWAFRGDATYDFGDDSFVKKVKVGARYSDRDQTVRYSLYNWGVLSEVWDGSGPVTFAETGPGVAELFSFANLSRGDGPRGLNAPYLSGNPATDYDGISAKARAINAIWRNQKGANSGGWTPAGARTGVLPGTAFLPSEVYSNSEDTKAAYLRLDFGTQNTDMLGGLKMSGNIGLRYIQTTDDANGFFTLPTRNQIIGGADSVATFCSQQTQPNPFCGLTAAQQAAVLSFSNGAATNQTTRNRFDHWLPSFNLKVGVTENLITRFAYSKAISRPRFEQLQSTIQIAPSNGISVFRLEASSRDSNPNLRPVEAHQFDLTAEWYFAKVGSLTGALFYKDLSNVIVANVAQTRSVTNNGVTQDVVFVGPQNATRHSSIKGFEVAYQQTFDFLPGVLSGIGVQANYTYVDASNVPQGRGGVTNSPTTTIDVSRLPLEGLSRHTANGTVFYDRGPLSMRLAYNWRSRYLLTIRDEIVPYLPIYSAPVGQLDGTILLSVNEQFKIGIQAVNLSNTTTKTESVINAEGLRAPRNYFRNDRRFSLTTRLKF